MTGELGKLQGIWEIRSLESDGTAAPETSFRGSRIVVQGDRFTTESMGATYEGTLEVEPRKTPRTLDLIFDTGPEKGNRSLGIYHLDGDTWTICLAVTAKKRPTDFATKAGDGYALETLVRREAPRRPDTLRAELASLEGTWLLVSGERDGQELPEEFVRGGKRVTRGNETTVRFGAEVYLKAAFSLDPSSDPKAIDYILTAGPNQGEMQHGIYAVEKDTVSFCFAPPGQPRPSAFATRKGGGETLTVWTQRKTKPRAKR